VALALFLTIILILICFFLYGKTLGHGLMLTIGYAFYVLFPFVVFEFDIYRDGPGYDIWNISFSSIYNSFNLVFVYSFVYFIAYKLGYFIAGKSNLVPLKFNRPINTIVSYFVFLILSAIFFYYCFNSRSLLFSGYSIFAQNDDMGPLASVHLFTLVIFLNLIEWKQSERLLYMFGGLLFVSALVLLSLGGRLYFLISIIALSIYFLNLKAGRTMFVRLKYLVFSGFIIILLGFVAIWRVGDYIGIEALFKYVIAEPILTSISMASLINCDYIHLFSYPINFISSVANLLPIFLFPDKHTYLIPLDSNGICLDSPFGATNIAFAMIFNFGIVGSVFAIAFFSYVLKVIKGVGESWWLYNFICALLPCMFFRDGFLIFNKVFLMTLIGSMLMIYVSRVRLK
jgi:hypothetical protein